MFDQIQNRFTDIFKSLRRHGKINEKNITDSLRSVRRVLLEADVNFKVARDFVSRVQEKVIGQKVLNSVTPGQQFIKVIKDELTEFLGGSSDDILLKTIGTTVILLSGLQGSGKTTTAVKLGSFLNKRRQLNCYLIAADRQRPAAVKQLQVLAEKNQIGVFTGSGNDPIAVVKAGIIAAVKEKADVIIVDTAGRLHVDDSLMEELKTISEICNPDEILFVADGMTGQDAVNSSKVFSEFLNITGIILTKMDGDTRGGAAVSIREITGKPIKFIGTGESVTEFEVFHPERMAGRILGMGDVVGLVEKAQNSIDKKEAENLQKKLLDNSFTLADFQQQINQFRKMGSMEQIMNMIPMKGRLTPGDFDEKQIVWMNAIIDSMTPDERIIPGIINGSRRKRIASGSGRSVFEVNQLIKQFFQMKTLMKKINKKGGSKFPINIPNIS